MLEEIKADVEGGKLDQVRAEMKAEEDAAAAAKAGGGESGQIDSSSEPVIKDEENIKEPGFESNSTAIVCIGDQPKTEEVVEEEILSIDKLQAVKNWTMQSPDWKFFNALFEIITEDQLQYKCKNGKTIFENFAKIITLALTNSED